MVGNKGQARSHDVTPLRPLTSGDQHGHTKTAAEVLREKKEQAWARRERSEEWERTHPAEDAGQRGRRTLRPMTAPEVELQRKPSVERAPSAEPSRPKGKAKTREAK
mmetsp:Transcript_6803/g.17396  ORF Transcript_6803/g.17396 Transcript_6803/m.17396 type:complete len:107 (-) Transcript_6803:22-342(-)